MEQFEEETGKLAIWKGEVSKYFEKWKDRKEREKIKKEKLSIISQSRIEKKIWFFRDLCDIDSNV
ncbi:hypothetical protein LCGC14_1171810 [marine sediment metagenome]|uniref:Uncharacterized protein n=1 Tax=marine sediment metagenome TaxID=412755 RepID=A0A0F9P7T0_9ZZZZ|nr:hypothetical protein [archaeon]